MSNVHPMVEKAARAWCKRHAEACGLDEATLWAEREAGFVTEAQAALEACGALELERDARRYRWLRDQAVQDARSPWCVVWDGYDDDDDGWGNFHPCEGRELDDAVAAAIIRAEGQL